MSNRLSSTILSVIGVLSITAMHLYGSLAPEPAGYAVAALCGAITAGGAYEARQAKKAGK